MPRTMRAVVQRQYGGPEQLSVEDIGVPEPGRGEVLIRVVSADVARGVVHLTTGRPYLIRLMGFGLRRPKNRVAGLSMAGTVVAVGEGVTEFVPGDDVWGELRGGAFAEYALARASDIAKKPGSLDFVDAAAATTSATTALQAVRDAGQLRRGHRVLIHGASGGVGTFAVQIAKALGAYVTAVCSTANVDLVRELGADEVLDYTRVDFVDGGARFDLMLDTVGNRSMRDCRSVLVGGGTFVAVALPDSGDWIGPLVGMAKVTASGWFRRQRMKTFLNRPNEDYDVLARWFEEGRLRAVIDREYPLEDAVDAVRYVAQQHARGKVVLRVSDE